jgi:hypothetical protein
VSPILGFFADAIGKVIRGAIEKVIDIWNALKEAFQTVWDFVQPIIQKFGDFIGKAIRGSIEKVVEIWNGLKTAFQSVWDFIQPIISKIGNFIKDVIGGAVDFISAAISAIPSVFKTILNSIAGLFNRVVDLLGNFAFPKTILGIPVPIIGGKKVSDFIELPYLPTLYNGGKVGSYMKGGMTYMNGGMTYMKGGMMYGAGGMTYGPAQQAVPAILHGGEYVINHKAVQRIGTDALDRMNSLRISKPNLPTMPSVPSINMSNMRASNAPGASSTGTGYSTQNVNIYVDNFIGEPEWFKGMMKEYNTKVLPRNQKAAGLENRVINTYNGINRGM